MVVGPRSRCRTSVSKRHSWPKTRVHHLETIPESPRSPPKKSFSIEIESRLVRSPEKDNTDPLLEGLDDDSDSVLPEAVQAQMQWYNHHLAQSYRDRERLATKVSDLEIVCRSQSKVNTSLQKAVTSWQHNYQSIEAELIQATEQIEEAKASIRRLKTANSNLRYTLCQLKEDQERAERKRWRNRLQRSWQSCIRWIQPILPDNLFTSSRRHSNGRPPARQDFNDKSGSVTPVDQSDNESLPSINLKIPSSGRRFNDLQRPRPLSSHPPDHTVLGDQKENA